MKRSKIILRAFFCIIINGLRGKYLCKYLDRSDRISNLSRSSDTKITNGRALCLFIILARDGYGAFPILQTTRTNNPINLRLVDERSLAAPIVTTPNQPSRQSYREIYG